MAKQLTTEQFIEKAKKVHGDKYDYSETIYNGIKEKIKIICPKHGFWLCNPSDHTINKSGCSKCAGKGKVTNPLDYFIERSNNIHNDFYNYDKFTYKSAQTKSIIVCPIHGEFSMHPNNHMMGAGCKECSNIIGADKRKLDINNIKSKLIEVHMNKYEYPTLINYTNSNDKLDIICPIHGEFQQSFINHYYKGHGCEKCGNNKLSKGEKTIEEILIFNNIEHIREKSFDGCINPKTNRKLLFDFYLPKQNLCIEYDGKQHFIDNNFFTKRSGNLKSLQERDQVKNQFCKDNNIGLLRISYIEFSNINLILKGLLDS